MSDWSATVSTEAADTIKAEAQRARGVETGGILIGSYDGYVCHVVEATVPPVDSVLEGTTFLRGTAGLLELLAARWRQTPRLHYVGEWHTHPRGSVAASVTDDETMRRIALDLSWHCTAPISLIFGEPDGDGIPTRMSAYIYPDGAKAQLEVAVPGYKRAAGL